MDNCTKILCLLQQNRKGISIPTIAKLIGLDESTVYRHLARLENIGKATYKEGIAHAITEEEVPVPGSPERYFQWRGTIEGGHNRFFNVMFNNSVQGKGTLNKPSNNLPKPSRGKAHTTFSGIPNPDEIDAYDKKAEKQ